MSADATSSAGPAASSGRTASVLAALIVLALYGLVACTADSELGSRTAAEDYYNRLADGFSHGRLSLEVAPPAWLTALPNPYDPKATAAFQGQRYSPGRIHDLSYYHGRLYLYFSVVPALAVFFPYHLLTGGYLSHQEGCFLFGAAGFLAAAALLASVRRQCFPRAGPVAVALGTLCLGLVPLVLLVLERSDVWEVPIIAAYACWMLALLFTWRSLHGAVPSWPSALGASVAVGLAIGCRPNGCLGAALLLLPAWRLLRRDPASGRSGRTAAVAALLVPIAVIGAGLLAYNYARFGDIFEFGQKYQLSGGEEESVRRFSPGFFWYDFRLYFLAYPGWQRVFPFVRELSPPPMPPGHRAGDNPVGVLGLLPFLLCVGGLPLGLRRLQGASRRRLAAIAGGILVVFLAGALPLCLFISCCLRYEVEFVPALALLAAIGFLALVSDGVWPPRVRRGVVAAAGCAAAVSIAFNLLMTANLRGNTYTGHGLIAARSGDTSQALVLYQRALRLQPANSFAQVGLADMYVREHRYAEATVALQKATRLVPDSPAIRVNDAYCLFQLGRLDEAMAECESALRLQPDSADAANLEREIREARAGAP